LIQDKLLTSPTNTLYSKINSHVTIGTTDATDLFNSDLVRRAVRDLRVRVAVPTDGSLYTCVVHPANVFDLRVETGALGWLLPNQYGSDQSRIWNGEIGTFEGCKFVENPRTRSATDGASSARVRRAFFLGREALAEDVI